MNRTRAKRLGVVVVVALAASGAAGCEAAQKPGAAALVGNSRIPISTVQDLTREMDNAGANLNPDTQLPLEPAQAQQRVLGAIIGSRVIAEAAKEAGVSLSQGQIQTRTAQLVQDDRGIAGVRDQLAKNLGLPPSYVDDYARDYVLLESVQNKVQASSGGNQAKAQQGVVDLLASASKALNVTVNPRYGVWDAPNMRVTDANGSDVVQEQGGSPSPAPSAPAETPAGQ